MNIPVPFCINPVQRKEYDRQYIRPYRIVRPGRINLTACYIFDIIFITHIVILCCSVVHRRIMYNNTGITRCSNSAPTWNAMLTGCSALTDERICSDFLDRLSTSRDKWQKNRKNIPHVFLYLIILYVRLPSAWKLFPGSLLIFCRTSFCQEISQNSRTWNRYFHQSEDSVRSQTFSTLVYPPKICYAEKRILIALFILY